MKLDDVRNKEFSSSNFYKSLKNKLSASSEGVIAYLNFFIQILRISAKIT